MSEEKEWIVIFDSGVGGITVLSDAIRALPQEHYYYYADVAHVPYGTKSKDEVRAIVCDAIEVLNKQISIKALVLACNTATSVAIKNLRASYPFPIIGMEPAIKPAVLADQSGQICVMATQLTLQEEKYQDLVQNLNADDRVIGLPMPELVDAAEDFDFDSASLQQRIKIKLSTVDWSEISAVVIGCTHFIYYKKLLARQLPAHIRIIDGNQGTIKQLKSRITLNTDSQGALNCSLSGKEIENELIKPYMDYLRKVNTSHERT